MGLAGTELPKRIPNHRPHTPLNTPDAWRGSAAKRGYDRQWRKFRLWFLQANPLCLFCEQAGRITSATEVDHIQRIAAGGPRLDPANCRPLCKPCHSAHTQRTRLG